MVVKYERAGEIFVPRPAALFPTPGNTGGDGDGARAGYDVLRVLFDGYHIPMCV